MKFYEAWMYAISIAVVVLLLIICVNTRGTVEAPKTSQEFRVVNKSYPKILCIKGYLYQYTFETRKNGTDLHQNIIPVTTTVDGTETHLVCE